MNLSKASAWGMGNALRVAGAMVATTALASTLAFCQTATLPARQASSADNADQIAAALGIHFVQDSSSTLLVQRNGKTYLVDVARHSIREIPAAGSPNPALREVSYSTSKPASNRMAEEQTPPATAKRKKHSHVYRPGDDALFNLPTGRRVDRHGLIVDFSHRFPYEAAFTGPARGGTLLGLDDFSTSSFGFRYGVTKNLSVSAYRSPSIAARVIELGGTYHLFSEQDGKPLNVALRFSVDGQNDFQRNFTTNFELLLSRSISRRAQVYLVPTGSLNNRPLISQTSIVAPPPYLPCSAPIATGTNPALGIHGCADTFALGAGLSVDVRPTVAVIAEVIPTLVNGEALGIHRPPFAFGIQKKIFRHAFTLGFTTGPGTTTSQRISTRAAFLGQPGADVPSNMFIGFNLNRELR